jgi:hypothetical protein
LLSGVGQFVDLLLLQDEAVGVGDAGGDGVDRDAARAEFLRQPARELLDGRLAAGIGAAAGHCLSGAGGRDGNDAPVVFEPLRGLLQSEVDPARDVEHRVVVLLGELGGGAEPVQVEIEFLGAGPVAGLP